MDIFNVTPSSVKKTENVTNNKIQKSPKGYMWACLKNNTKNAHDFLKKNTALEALLIDSLLKFKSISRVTDYKKGTLIILRGLNFNPKKNIEETISIKLWIEDHMVITLNDEVIKSMADIQSSFESGANYPKTPGDFLIALIQGMTKRLDVAVEKLEDKLEKIEDVFFDKMDMDTADDLSNIRRVSLILRSQMLPQSRTLYTLGSGKYSFLTKIQRKHLLEYFHMMENTLSLLENIRSRAVVVHDEMNAKLNNQLNTQNYVLSVVAALFLPITFITGLFGMNVSGIPYANHPLSFTAVAGILLCIFVIILMVLKKKKWL
ncbi:MAG: hypothetical protein JXR30_01910 [Alphaproteobacteria bacterium]|nr:hypothetical protein [Alphaproteobacteria bacterium]